MTDPKEFGGMTAEKRQGRKLVPSADSPTHAEIVVRVVATRSSTTRTAKSTHATTNKPRLKKRRILLELRPKHRGPARGFDALR
jgi:hypothetical protein